MEEFKTGEVLFEKKGHRAYITLNRPEKLNVLNVDIYRKIDRIVDEIEDDPDIRVVIMKGNGKCFSAGYDIEVEVEIPGIMEARDRIRDINSFRWKIWKSKKPYIAQVHKYCLGGATNTVLPFDFIIGTEDMQFGEPEITFGAGPGFLMIPWQANMRQTKVALLTGKKYTGAEAAEIGLITKAVPADQLEAEVEALADELVKISPNAMALTKAGINRTYEIMGIRPAHDLWDDLCIFVENTRTDEVIKFNDMVKEKGVKAACAWRDEYFT